VSSPKVHAVRMVVLDLSPSQDSLSWSYSALQSLWSNATSTRIG
jgi:hypothetical protein